MMTSPLIIEWQTLQNNYEQHEKNALLIKVTSFAIFLLCLSISSAFISAIFIVLLCWVLESIIKTYQSRLGERLLNIEAAAIKNGNDREGM
jgi:dolichol kinase